MKLLIVEGIATSGKSTVINKLKEVLNDKRAVVYSEAETHIPIMDKPSELHINFFQSLISKALETEAKLVIFDRLYLTQAFRSNTRIDAYKNIEDNLLHYPTLTVFLKVDEDAIAERVRLASLHREEEWGEYVKTKGDTFKEISDYYINQQRSQLTLLKESKIEHIIFNTTKHDYDQTVQDILTKLS
jgi:thymidylate kinase